MSRYVQFITPENIEISYELAGIGSRFVSALVDHLLQLLILVAVWVLGMWLGGIVSIAALGTAYLVVALLLIASFLVIFGYFTFFELLWAGRTPGKRLTGLRTVRDGGYPIDVFASVVRNLVRIVDMMPPVTYGVGLLSVFFSTEYKRLGDWAAGTIVIKERMPGRFGARGMGPASPIVAHFIPQITNVDALSPEEYSAIRRFVERRHELPIPIQAHIGMRLARTVIPKLGLEHIPIRIQWHYADLMEAVERRYVEERGLLTSPVDLFAPLET